MRLNILGYKIIIEKDEEEYHRIRNLLKEEDTFMKEEKEIQVKNMLFDYIKREDRRISEQELIDKFGLKRVPYMSSWGHRRKYLFGLREGSIRTETITDVVGEDQLPKNDRLYQYEEKWSTLVIFIPLILTIFLNLMILIMKLLG